MYTLVCVNDVLRVRASPGLLCAAGEDTAPKLPTADKGRCAFVCGRMDTTRTILTLLKCTVELRYTVLTMRMDTSKWFDRDRF